MQKKTVAKIAHAMAMRDHLETTSAVLTATRDERRPAAATAEGQGRRGGRVLALMRPARAVPWPRDALAWRGGRGGDARSSGGDLA